MQPRPAASVVVPACNEEEHIGQLLSALCEAARVRPLRIVVAANGCTDATEQIAGTFDGVEVLSLDASSKHAALNAGDDAAGDAFPRLYTDADIRVSAASVVALLDALDVEQRRAAGPVVHYDLSKSPWLVRAYLRTCERLPFNEFWHATHLQGRGLYGASRAARTRFARFPALRSDDGYFDLQFDDDERVVVATAEVVLPCPTSSRELLRNQTRVVDGYHELVAWLKANQPDRPAGFTGTDGRGWRDPGLWWRSGFVKDLRHGRGWLDLAGFVVVDVVTRATARWRGLRGRDIPWR